MSADVLVVAYKRERQAARRLARGRGCTEAQALHDILSEQAGPRGLAALLAERHAAQAAAAASQSARRVARAARAAARVDERQLAPLGAAANGAWQGWFDASCHPNPGRIGLGGVLQGPHGERLELRGAPGHGDSSQAEYLALIALLEAALAIRPARLVVRGDSQVVLDDVLQPAGQGARVLTQYRATAQRLIAQLGQVTLQWVARHRNSAADALSQQALALPPGTALRDASYTEGGEVSVAG